MAVQKKVLARGYAGIDKVEVGANGTLTAIQAATGTLALGVPGNIYDATPARIVTAVLTADAEIGDVVTIGGITGIIVNAREYANVGTDGNPLAPTLNLPSGTTVSVCSLGHVVVAADKVDGILEKMVGRVIVGDAENDVIVVVEIDGVKAPASAEGDQT